MRDVQQLKDMLNFVRRECVDTIKHGFTLHPGKTETKVFDEPICFLLPLKDGDTDESSFHLTTISIDEDGDIILHGEDCDEYKEDFYAGEISTDYLMDITDTFTVYIDKLLA